MVELPHRATIDVRLPERESRGADTAAPIVLEVADAGGYRIDSEPVVPGGLAVALHVDCEQRPDKVLFVKGSRRVTYDVVLHAMDEARGAGVRTIGLT